MTIKRSVFDKARVFDLFDGFFAWDSGCKDSGIRDDVAREGLWTYLRELPRRESHVLIAEFMVSHFLSPGALRQGFGPEDARDFLRWLENDFNFCLEV